MTELTDQQRKLFLSFGVPSEELDMEYALCLGCDDGWEVVLREITGQRRWTTSKTAVYLHKETNRYIRHDWVAGSTECQDVDSNDEFFEV
ncbi:MAG: hypothetical protein ACPG4T_08755, partial [Nannocystaceae bacterium]